MSGGAHEVKQARLPDSAQNRSNLFNKDDQDAIRRLTSTLAEHSLTVNGKAKPRSEES